MKCLIYFNSNDLVVDQDLCNGILSIQEAKFEMITTMKMINQELSLIELVNLFVIGLDCFSSMNIKQRKKNHPSTCVFVHHSIKFWNYGQINKPIIINNIPENQLDLGERA